LNLPAENKVFLSCDEKSTAINVSVFGKYIGFSLPKNSERRFAFLPAGMRMLPILPDVPIDRNIIPNPGAADALGNISKMGGVKVFAFMGAIRVYRIGTRLDEAITKQIATIYTDMEIVPVKKMRKLKDF